MQPPPVTQLRRYRWWIVIAFAAVTLFTALSVVSSSGRKQRIIAAAQSQGAWVRTEFAGPDWLGAALDRVPRIKALLETRIAHVDYPSREDRNFRPIDLRYLLEAHELQNLDLLFADDLTDADLEIVGQLENLTRLWISSPKVTNAGLAQLTSLHQMEILWLGGSGFNDDGLRCLSKMADLKSLWLDGSPGFTGEGLKYLPQACRLESLHVTGTGFNHGLELINLGSLDHLSARVTPLPDASLAPLTDARTLRVLLLSNTPVTDEGLRHLDQLTQLNSVVLFGTPVTQVGAERLAAQLPHVTIVYGSGSIDQQQWAYGSQAQSVSKQTNGLDPATTDETAP